MTNKTTTTVTTSNRTVRHLFVLLISFVVFRPGKTFTFVPLASTKVRSSQSINEHHHHHILFSTTSPLYYRDGDDMVSSISIDDELLDDSTTNAARMTTAARMQQQQGPQQQQQQRTQSSPEESVSMLLINSIVVNQFLALMVCICVAFAGSAIFGFDMTDIHWNGDGMGLDATTTSHYYQFKSLFDWHITPTRLIEGVLAAIPMIGLANLVEQSQQRDATIVNFSTTNMVISLFGRRKRRRQQKQKSNSISDLDSTEGSDPSEVMALSCGVGVSTGISEEIIFRGLVPAMIYSVFHSVPIAAIGQAVIFAAGHISPHAKRGENRLIGSLQVANGLWYGMVYLLAGGDILPCIIAHALYDIHVLCETFTTTNNQMDYTEDASQTDLSDGDRDAILQLQQQQQQHGSTQKTAATLLGPETVNFARRFFFAFDHDHVGSLSRTDVQKACCYAFLQDDVIPSETRVNDLFDQIQQDRQTIPTTNYDKTTATTTATEKRPIQDNDRLTFPDFLKLLVVLRSEPA